MEFLKVVGRRLKVVRRDFLRGGSRKAKIFEGY